MTITEIYEEQPANYTTIMNVRENPNDYNSRRKETNKLKRSKLLKRLPLHRLMDLKVDFAFKQLFGNERNKHITVIFLNAILQKTGRDPIKNISFGNTETGGEYIDDKQSRLDLLVLTTSNEWINVEIQFSNTYEMIERSIYYWSKTYTNPLEKGMAYKELRPVIAINIFNFDLFSQTERFHTSYHLYEDEGQFQLTNLMEFHFIEMGKLIKDWQAEKLDPRNDVLARWLLMLGMVDHRNKKTYDDIYTELEVISMEDESLREAFQTWEELSMTQEQKLAYESRLKNIMDEEARQRRWELRKQETEQKERETKIREQETEQKERETKIREQETERREQGTKLREQANKKKEEEIKLGWKELEEGQKEIEQNQKEVQQSRKEIEQKKKEVEVMQNNVDMQKRKANQEGKVEIVRNLLASGVEIEVIATSTGLSKERIAEIKLEMQE